MTSCRLPSPAWERRCSCIYYIYTYTHTQVHVCVCELHIPQIQKCMYIVRTCLSLFRNFRSALCLYVCVNIYLYIHIANSFSNNLWSRAHLVVCAGSCELHVCACFCAHFVVCVCLYNVCVCVYFTYLTYTNVHTAILIIIDARYHDFNGFPVVNWY
jgi:hypothetical protein